MIEEWTSRYQALTTCRQTKIFWPQPDRIGSRQLLRLTREEYSQAIQIITGHNFMLRHRFICGESQDKQCRVCGLEEEETSEHIVLKCPYGQLVEFRLRHWGRHILNEGELVGQGQQWWPQLMSLIQSILPLEYSDLLGFGSDRGDVID